MFGWISGALGLFSGLVKLLGDWRQSRQQALERKLGAQLFEAERLKKMNEVRREADKVWKEKRDTSPDAVLDRMRRNAANYNTQR